MDRVKIGVIGLGFVGKSMYDSLQNKGFIPSKTLFGYDKHKNGGIGSLSECFQTDIVFLCLPTQYVSTSQSFDTTIINSVCGELFTNQFGGIVVIKSTIEPGTTKQLSRTFHSMRIVHNPEFLTARTAYEDFHHQKHIVIGYDGDHTDIATLVNFYQFYYQQANISMCSTLESESMKLFCNSFYAVKVQFFTELYLLCQKNGSDYNNIKTLMLKNGWINSMHTIIPGPDGQISYGGYCFPKDTNALNEYMNRLGTPHNVLNGCITERNIMRNDNTNCS